MTPTPQRASRRERRFIFAGQYTRAGGRGYRVGFGGMVGGWWLRGGGAGSGLRWVLPVLAVALAHRAIARRFAGSHGKGITKITKVRDGHEEGGFTAGGGRGRCLELSSFASQASRAS